ncbi:MAG: hypothetical protein GEU28_02440 [Dehalococcoidia bacterium]|nr:hypothetical protein [Dehalococcoidia bacterium]
MVAIPRSAPAALPRTWHLPVSGRTIVVLGLVGLAMLGLLRVVQSSYTTSTGFTVTELEQQRTALHAEVNNLENDVTVHASLNRVEAEARGRLGMVEPTQRIFVTVDEAAPPLDRLPARYQPAIAKEDAGDLPWWQKALSALGID